MSSDCSSVGRVVSVNTRSPLFESSHCLNFIMNIYTENFWNDEKKEAGIMFWKYSHHFPNEVGWNSRPEVHDLQLHRLQRPVGGERDVGLAKAALYRHVPKISEKLPRHQRSYLCFVKRIENFRRLWDSNSERQNTWVEVELSDPTRPRPNGMIKAYF